jgi:large subunit ribosomal protein L15
MLNQISPAPGSRRARKRIGRGTSAGGGTTAGRGTKGHQSRSGYSRRAGFEGGQTPLLRRQPKLGGFRHPNHTEYEIINISTLEEKLEAGSYDVPALNNLKLISTKKPVKVLGRGELKKKLNLSVNAASKTAREAIEKAGGSVTIV